jgi:hypothetical protein
MSTDRNKREAMQLQEIKGGGIEENEAAKNDDVSKA